MTLAGALGIEPSPAVLETAALTNTLRPNMGQDEFVC